MHESAQRLTALKKAWQELGVAPHSLAAIGLPEKESRFIEDLIDRLAGMALELDAAPVESLTMVRRSCEDQLNHLEAFFTATEARGAGNPGMRMLGFITLLLQLQSLLNGALVHTTDSTDTQDPSQKIA